MDKASPCASCGKANGNQPEWWADSRWGLCEDCDEWIRGVTRGWDMKGKRFPVLYKVLSQDESIVWLILACGHSHFGWKSDELPAEEPKWRRCLCSGASDAPREPSRDEQFADLLSRIK